MTEFVGGIIEGIGGRKFAAFVSASVALVLLHTVGIELTPDTLDAISAMFMAFVAGNGVEHISRQFGGKSLEDGGWE